MQSKHYEEFLNVFPNQAGQNITITGTTSGTGFVAAKTCLVLGAHVIVLNRASERATKAEAELRTAIAAGSTATLTCINCDLQDFESVRAAAAEIKQKYKKLDVLINNAGIMAMPDQATKDGYDVQMQTNHLSHFLLTKELLPLLLKGKSACDGGAPRVVSHSSIARNGKPISAKYLQKNGGNLGGDGASMLRNGARWERYHQTKLANIVFTLALNDEIRKHKVNLKALCAAPGLAATNLQVTTHAQGGMSETWIMRFAHSAEDGTLPLLCCALGLDAGKIGAVGSSSLQKITAKLQELAALQGGEFVEPANKAGMSGPPVVNKKLSKACTDVASRGVLWKESEAAVGSFSLAVQDGST